MNKSIKKILFVLFWLILGVLISALDRYLGVISVGEYGWADSFPVWIGGAAIGSISAIVLLIIDYFLLKKKIVNKVLLNVSRIVLLYGIIKIVTALHEASF